MRYFWIPQKNFISLFLHHSILLGARFYICDAEVDGWEQAEIGAGMEEALVMSDKSERVYPLVAIFYYISGMVR